MVHILLLSLNYFKLGHDFIDIDYAIQYYFVLGVVAVHSIHNSGLDKGIVVSS